MALNKRILFSSKNQVESFREKIISTTNEKMKELLQSGEGIDFLKKIKFYQCGYDPLFDEQINFIEQTNQTFTYLVCLSAVELLLTQYPEQKFYVNFGTESGYDVVTEDEQIICECFAVTSSDSNNKLELDTNKVYNNKDASKKYVIYYTSNPKPKHVANIKNKYQGVEIIALDNI